MASPYALKEVLAIEAGPQGLANEVQVPEQQIPQSRSLRLTPLPWLLVSGLLLLILLVRLGYWQLERAAEKRALLAAHQQTQAQAPQDISAMGAAQLSELADYLPVRLRGQLLADVYWLLDNQTHQGKFGYQLLQLVQTDGATLLLNRGWLPGDLNRQLPSVDFPAGELWIEGRLAPVSGNPLISQWQSAIGDPRINAIALPAMGEQAGRPVSRLMQIAPQDPLALLAHWPPVNILPAKHTAYAVQWFCMALALLVLLLFANTNLTSLLAGSKGRDNNNE